MCSDYSESDDQESKSLDACLWKGKNKIKRAQSAPLDSSDDDTTSNVIKAAIAASNQKLLQENSTSEDEDKGIALERKLAFGNFGPLFIHFIPSAW